MSSTLAQALRAYDLAGPETLERAQATTLIIAEARKINDKNERYAAWLAQVNYIVGTSVDPDGYARTLYREGASPQEAAQEIVEEY